MSWKKRFPTKGRYFETGNGILYNCDCLKLLKDFPNESVDLLLTDPPYGVGSDEKNGIDYKDDFYDVGTFAKEVFRILKDNTRAFVFTAQKTLFSVVEAFESAGFSLHQILVWYKPNLAGGTGKKVFDFTSTYEMILNFHKGKPPKIRKNEGYNNFDVLRYTQPQKNYKKDKRFHIHQKPLELIKHLVLASTEEGQLILDPFVGSGTTAVACESLDRKWVGIEINEGYCRIARERVKRV